MGADAAPHNAARPVTRSIGTRPALSLYHLLKHTQRGPIGLSRSGCKCRCGAVNLRQAAPAVTCAPAPSGADPHLASARAPRCATRLTHNHKWTIEPLLFARRAAQEPPELTTIARLSSGTGAIKDEPDRRGRSVHCAGGRGAGHCATANN